MDDESQPDSARVFSVRIVDIDYYMAPPIPEMDICYSSFQGGKVNEVPVIRIFGSTPAGQKTCLHMHKAFPYLYVPCSDIQIALDVQQGDDGYKHHISHALEKALKLKGKVGSKRQHVHACSLVRARKLYGYFSTEELFVKIYLYHPQDVARAANLLLGGAVFDKCLQPHEAHIPFILQFLVDYNLYGMGHVHLSKMKFRHPLPDRVTQPCIENLLSDKLNCSSPSSKADSPVWISSTVPASWRWQVPDTLSSSPDHKFQLVKRLSTCMLEGDSTTDEILNQHHKVFLSQSQTCSDVKMVQSLIPIWEEEYERTGLSNAYRVPPPDPGKPCQSDVLKILLVGSEMEKSITELLLVAESSSNPIDEDVKLIQPMSFLNNVGKTDELEKAAFIGNMDHVECSIDTKVLPGSTCNKHYTASVDRGKAIVSEQMEIVGTLTPKSSVEEILGVLKWLASSQAGEDVNSDDELLRDTILNPLLPAASINMVLEKASNDYDSAFQLECQDILNSIEAANDDDCINKKLELIDDTLTPQTPPKNGIPQADGFHIDRCNNPRSDTSPNFKSAEASHSPRIDTSLNFESAEAFQPPELLENSGLTSKEKDGRRWGVLPFCIHGSVIGNHQDVCFDVVKSDSTEKGRNPNIPVKDASIDPSEVTATSASCSLRDLMRKKRSYRVSSPECESNRAKRGRIKEQQDLSTWTCANSEPLSAEEGHHDLKSLGPHDLKSPSTEFDTKITEHTDTNSASYGELSTSSRNSSHFQINATTERCNNSSAVGLDVVSKSVMLEDSSTLPFDNYPHGSLKPSCTISDLKSFASVLPRESEPLLDSDFSNYEPVSKSYVDKPTEQMGLGVPCLSSGFPLDGKEINICQNSESGILGKCMRNLSYEVLHETHARLQISSCDDEHRRMNHSTACGSLPVLDIEGETAGVHKTTICDESEPEEQGGGNPSDECPSQFVKDSYEEMEDQNTYSSKDDDPSCSEEALTDGPAHHCIDGSVVYMMTPASVPPTTESVCSWLLKLDSAAHFSEEQLLDIFSHSASPHMDRSNSEDRENNNGCDVGKYVFVNEAENLKMVCNNTSQDFSQISGPFGKSRTTPLSQTGFRDPASIGCGQQLTLLSLEILAESRGDLRPDPRYDAIKVLAFAVKDDNDSGASLHALLHTPELNERNLDGLMGCSILHFYEEKQLFMYLVDFICLLDPDILLGWDIQGGSLGFLAERASQLGISLLNKISRTPSETKMDCSDSDGLDKIFHVDEVPEHENSDFILRDGGAIEDEWGRTHASGLHVDGRIVLNVWRLMRSEVKLTMYTVEAVAEAVLRRKVSLEGYSPGFTCIGFGRSEDFTILGDLFLKDKIIIYDLERQMIGWRIYDCSVVPEVGFYPPSGPKSKAFISADLIPTLPHRMVAAVFLHLMFIYS
uniref:DNA polymerase zeta catalytic subunit n=3 Tax=Kalanchoe fedtschenkoi TaxID=63787 RepID=A0A7N0V413_KALFE